MMSRKHIVLLGPAWPYRGGPALFMTFLYEQLIRDFRVDFIHFRMMYPRLLFPGTTPLDLSREHRQPLPGPRLLHSLHPWYWWRTARHIRRLNPNLIVFDWYQPFFGPMYFFIGLFLPVSLRRRIFFITENVISHEARAVDRLLTRMGLFWSRGFLALSGQVAQDLAPYAGSMPMFRSELPIFEGFGPAVTTDNLADRAQFGLPPDARVLLFFGYIRRYKGLDLLIRALDLLRQKDPRYTLLIAGECYEDPTIYTSLIQSLGLEDRVHFQHAYIPNEEVAPWFRAADLVVLPYRSATQSGILNLAYGLERPVLCTNVGGLGEFIDDGLTGIIVPEASPASLAEGITRFYDLRETVSFRDHIRERAASNSFQHISAVFRDALARLDEQPAERSGN